MHHDTIKPSLVKGKEVYCEWPLASTLAEAEELHALANKNNARTMIGLQGQLSPIILKVKSPIEHQNRIGKVLSSFVVASGGTSSRSTLSEGLKYFTKKDVGGNMVTIGFAHMIDVVELVLGEFLSFNSLLSIQRPQVPIRSGTGEITETVTTNVADHIVRDFRNFLLVCWSLSSEIGSKGTFLLTRVSKFKVLVLNEQC